MPDKRAARFHFSAAMSPNPLSVITPTPLILASRSQLVLTLEDFEHECADIFESIHSLASTVMGIVGKCVPECVLVGGAMRIPRVQVRNVLSAFKAQGMSQSCGRSRFCGMSRFSDPLRCMSVWYFPLVFPCAADALVSVRGTGRRHQKDGGHGQVGAHPHIDG